MKEGVDQGHAHGNTDGIDGGPTEAGQRLPLASASLEENFAATVNADLAIAPACQAPGAAGF